MRAVVLVLAACGRIGFDGGDPTATDANGDVALCDPRTVGTLQLAGTPVVMRAAPLSNGYAVAIQTTMLHVYVARVTSTLSLASQHLPLASGYQLGGISALNDAVFIHTINGPAYLKVLHPSWDTYATIEDADPRVVDPPLARTGSTALRIGLFGGLAKVEEMNDEGVKSGVMANYAPGDAKSASIVAVEGGARAAVEVGTTCETYTVAANGTTSRHHVRAACRRPRVGVLASGRGVLVHESSAGEDLYMLPPS